MNARGDNLLFWGLLAAILFTGGAAVVSYLGGRGIRNNNPGNIRLSGTTWQGQVPPAEQTDDEFVQFTDPKYGIRAMARILNNYALRGLNTIREVISTWAPPSENNTESYIHAVAQRLNLSPDSIIVDSAKPALIAAIIQHENGSQPYPVELIKQGISLA